MADTEQQAMMSERLAELTRKHDAAIDALWESAENVHREDYMDARSLWFELRAEVARLRAREAALLAVAQRVAASADGNMLMCMCGMPMPTTRYDTPTTVFIGAPVHHAPDCIFEQARALLAAGEQAAQGYTPPPELLTSAIAERPNLKPKDDDGEQGEA